MISSIDVHKTYTQGKKEIRALAGVSLDIRGGEFAVIMGPSGSGKSTLLHLMGALDRPTRGEILIEGRALSRMSDRALTLLRRGKIGFVFQFFNLLPTLSGIENVMLPLILDGRSATVARQRAQTVLQAVGLAGREEHLPEELSGGEIQRFAIARALAFQPPILLADEPTGNLDSKAGEEVLALLRRINREEGCTVVMVTHNREAADYGDRIVSMRDGKLAQESA
jgi:putative ABC transport system ATP-binding protein